MRRRIIIAFILFLIVAFIVACATSPTGRRQLAFFPTSEMNQMGVAAFEQIQEETPRSQDQAKIRYVNCVTDALLAHVPRSHAGLDWNIVLFDDDAVNAFALPGGKMGVYTGLLRVAENQHQLAAVIGHEIGHVIAEHGNERMSTAYATGAGLQIVSVLGGERTAQRDRMMGLLGLGAQFGIILPFSRTQEREADIIGLDLMAEAGFNPEESVSLWRNMARASGNGPPEFLSTHPSSDTRIRDLTQHMPRARSAYEKALEGGRRPQCD